MWHFKGTLMSNLVIYMIFPPHFLKEHMGKVCILRRLGNISHFFCFTHEENQNSGAENCSTVTLLDISFVDTTLGFIEALSDDQSCESYKLQLSRSLKATISDLEKTSGNLLEVYYPGTHKRCTKIRSSVSGVMQYSVGPIHRSVVEFAIQDSEFSAFYKLAIESGWIEARATQLRCCLGGLVLNPSWTSPPRSAFGDSDQRTTELASVKATSFFAIARCIDHNVGIWSDPDWSECTQEFKGSIKLLDERFSSFDKCWHDKYCYMIDDTNDLCEIEPRIDMLSLAALNGLVHCIDANVPISSYELRETPLLFYVLAGHTSISNIKCTNYGSNLWRNFLKQTIPALQLSRGYLAGNI